VLLTSQSRRAAGLLAVTTIGLSTAVLSVTGVASATVEGDFTFSTLSSDEATVTVGNDGLLDIPAGYCSIKWTVAGAQGGGDGVDYDGDRGGFLYEVVDISGAQTYRLSPGTAGADATQESGEGLGDGDGGEGGHNAVGDDGTKGTGFGSGMGTLYGGGGGAGSRVEVLVDEVAEDFLFAYGGDGIYADSDDNSAAGVGAGGTTNVYSNGDTDTSTSDNTGNGYISGDAVACGAPPTDNPNTPTDPNVGDEEEDYVTGAPIVNWVLGVENGLKFQTTISMVASDNPVKGLEYSLNGAEFIPIATENAGDYQYSGTIPGLEAGTSYSVSFRFTTAKGHTDASPVTTAKTAVPGPVGVTAVSGASSIKVNWTAPADMNGVAGYVAIAAPDGDRSSGREVSCQPAEALGTSCVLPAIPGLAYGVSVHSLDATGNPIGRSDWVVTTPVSAPAISTTLPKADGTLTTDDADGKVVAGEKVTISGKDFLPGSTVDVIVYSTPVKLGSVVVGTDGTFSYTVTLPKDLENGVHHLVASGVDVNGNARNMVVEVTVSGGTAVLAFTGFSALPYLGGGALAVLAGAGLLVASRRRQAA
jgi:hypothetical protein